MNDFNVNGLSTNPFKTDPPLIIYPNAVSTCPISLESLKPITWWSLQVLKTLCAIDVQQFTAGSTLDFLRQFLGNLAKKYLLRFSGGKGFDHTTIISLRDNIVKRYI
jgi:hypothetical protein